jgi:hypothetical protein
MSIERRIEIGATKNYQKARFDSLLGAIDAALQDVDPLGEKSKAGGERIRREREAKEKSLPVPSLDTKAS